MCQPGSAIMQVVHAEDAPPCCPRQHFSLIITLPAWPGILPHARCACLLWLALLLQRVTNNGARSRACTPLPVKPSLMEADHTFVN